MRISDWSSDVFSSDLKELVLIRSPGGYLIFFDKVKDEILGFRTSRLAAGRYTVEVSGRAYQPLRAAVVLADVPPPFEDLPDNAGAQTAVVVALEPSFLRSEEHTSEFQSLMRISYAVFCLKKKKIKLITTTNHIQLHHTLRKKNIRN